MTENIQAYDTVLANPHSLVDEDQTYIENTDIRKYRKSSLSDDKSYKILKQLLHVMRTDRPFLDPELTLPELSNRLSVSTNHLSQVLNGTLRKNYFDFVNEYRTREAGRLLFSPESSHLSIIGIAMEAGFNSKNAFYSAFKKHTGMTPSQFRQQRRNADQAEELFRFHNIL